MDYSAIPLFSLMKAKLSYLSERQSILAQNVANADTPGYKAKDLAEPDFKKMAMVSGQGTVRKLQMLMTSPLDIRAKATPEMHFTPINRPNTNELNPNGNNVSIEEEMAKIAQNQGEYQKALNLYSKAVSMFKTAIGNPNTTS